MFDSLKNILIGKNEQGYLSQKMNREEIEPLKQIQVATAAIFIELAGADGE